MNKTDPIKTWVAFVIILLGTVLVFHNTLQIPWHFDDQKIILENVGVTDLRTAWNRVMESRGITYLTFALNYYFQGFDLRSFHLVNLAIHFFNACLVFLLIDKFFQGKRFLAIVGALIFLIHPVNTQAVNYIVQRMTLLCALFTFLATHLYILAREHYATRRFVAPLHLLYYIAFLSFSCLAVMTKQNAAMLPVMLVLVELFIIKSNLQPLSRKRTINYLAPTLLAPALLTIQIIILPMFSGSPLSEIGTHENLLNTEQHISNLPLHYFVTQFSVLWIYIKLLFFPYPLLLDYGYPIVSKLVSLQSILAGTGLIIILGTTWRYMKKFPFVAFGIFWFFIALTVESSFIPLDPVFEHRLYIPLFGFIIILCYLLDSCVSKQSTRIIVATIYIAVIASLSIQRNSVWAEPIAFFENEAKHTYSSYRPHMMLANAYYEAGRKSDAKQTYDRIVAGIEEKSVRNVQPRMLLNIAVAYERFGEYLKAEELLKLAISKQPEYLNAHYNLGVVYYRKGELHNARSQFALCYRLNPTHAAAASNFASVSIELDDIKTAEQLLPAVMRLAPMLGQQLLIEIEEYRQRQ